MRAEFNEYFSPRQEKWGQKCTKLRHFDSVLYYSRALKPWAEDTCRITLSYQDPDKSKARLVYLYKYYDVVSDFGRITLS